MIRKEYREQLQAGALTKEQLNKLALNEQYK
jgi:hypothetical protein